MRSPRVVHDHQLPSARLRSSVQTLRWDNNNNNIRRAPVKRSFSFPRAKSDQIVSFPDDWFVVWFSSIVSRRFLAMKVANERSSLTKTVGKPKKALRNATKYGSTNERKTVDTVNTKEKYRKFQWVFENWTKKKKNEIFFLCHAFEFCYCQ